MDDLEVQGLDDPNSEIKEVIFTVATKSITLQITDEMNQRSHQNTFRIPLGLLGWVPRIPILVI